MTAEKTTAEIVDAGLQQKVAGWMQECFGPEISADKLERNDRFIEEALELVQACDYPKERVLALVDYVYGRDIGEPKQEVGGVMITLAALCLANGMDMDECGEVEYQRISLPEIILKIRAKQAAKPTGSALPIAALSPPISREAKPTPAEIEFLQCLLDRYSENGGIIDLGEDHEGFMRIVRKHYIPRPTRPGLGQRGL